MRPPTPAAVSRDFAILDETLADLCLPAIHWTPGLAGAVAARLEHAAEQFRVFERHFGEKQQGRWIGESPVTDAAAEILLGRC